MTHQKFGDQFSKCGFIAEIGNGSFGHFLGGNMWTASGPLESLGQPTLLLCLDLADPSLAIDFGPKLAQLPLFSYINHDGLIERQHYLLLPETRAVRFTSTSDESVHLLDEPDRLPTPLTTKPLKLREMSGPELPVDENSYWTACDSFVGGDAFLRISGPPVWLQDVAEPTCTCGRKLDYIASVGYEGTESPKGYVSESEAFYLGEFALYFFACPNCFQVEVISQPV